MEGGREGEGGRERGRESKIKTQIDSRQKHTRADHRTDLPLT